VITRCTEYARSSRSTLLYWQLERWVWLVMIPLGLWQGWLRSVAFVSVLSVYALYQNAVQRVDQIRAIERADG
jgi:hypothetical protein